MRRHWMVRIAMAGLLALVLGACGGGDDGGAIDNGTSPTPTETGGGAGAEVKVVDIDYDPKTLTVPAGTTVTWTWEGNQDHTVTADDQSFESDIKRKGATFTHTFDTAGTFEYYCKVHSTPDGNNQNGTITVT